MESYPRLNTGYERVGVLCLTFEDDDMQCKETEVDKLKHIFEHSFGFETDFFEIPSDRSETALDRKLSDFCYKYDRPDCLTILYYGGHGYQDVDTNKFKIYA